MGGGNFLGWMGEGNYFGLSSLQKKYKCVFAHLHYFLFGFLQPLIRFAFP